MRHHTLSLLFALAGVAGFSACASSEDPTDVTPIPGTGGGGGEMPVTPDYEVVTCEGAPTAAPQGAACEVTPGDDRILIVGDVLQSDRVLESGAVLVEDGAIACVGCDCVDQAAGATTVVCPDAVVSPGLIDAHDHVGWMNGRPWVAADENVDPALRWEHRHDWRRGKRGNPEVDVDGGGSSTDEKIFGELRFALSGATSKFGSGDLGGVLRDLDNTGDGDNGLDQPGAKYDTFPLGDSSGWQENEGCAGYNIEGPAAGFYDSHAPHVAEGIDHVARNEFFCLTGQGDGASEVLDDRTAIIHGTGLTAAEIGTMAATGMKLIWSPRSNIALYGDTAPITVYDQLGVSIGLGTDWIPSGSMNMLRELQCAADFNEGFLGGYFSDRRLWQMATEGSARALAFDDVIGRIDVGYAADLAVYANSGREHYRAVVRAELPDVALVMRGGEVLTGDAPVVAALETGCDTLDVCGASKAVCLQRDTGRSLSAVQSAASGGYPLFFCGTPDDEPSCLPARILPEDSLDDSSLYAGQSTMDDPDGDGIVEGDNCPAIFNPIRPVDQGRQADADGDSVGDACDGCPFDAGAECDGIDPNDTDGDGIANGADNCPGQSNQDQADGDGDGKGDLCDPCPTESNPGGLACPGTSMTVFAVQDPSEPAHPAEGDRVRVECVITAVTDEGAWCQDPVGGAYSGVAIFAGGAPSYEGGGAVALWDRVQVDGDVAEFFEVTQLENPSFVSLGVSAPLGPEVVSPADIATGGALGEAYEGVLVEVQGVSVTDQNPDDPDDFDEFTVTGGLRIDDFVADGGGNGGTLDNTYPAGTSFGSIVGIHHFSFGNRKLCPRSAADISAP